MRKQTLKTLEVFRYASSEQSATNHWNKAAIGRIEKQLIKDKSLSRLSALILQKAVVQQQLSWFSQTSQILLKTTATQLMVDVASKKHLIQQLIPILELNKIPVILLKGMAFNHNLYSEAAPRGVSDIDILIKPEDQDRFKAVFTELASLVETDKKHAFDDLYEQTWRSNNHQHLIDVHTHLTNPHLFDICEVKLWQRAKPHPAYSSENVRVLSAEDTICHLVTHIINDNNFFHYNLIDVKKVVLAEDVDKSLLAQIAQKWGVFNATCFVLQTVNEFLDNPLVLVAVKQGWFTMFRIKLARMIIERLFTLTSTDKSPLHRFKQLCCYAFVLDRGEVIFKMSLLYLFGLASKLKP